MTTTNDDSRTAQPEAMPMVHGLIARFVFPCLVPLDLTGLSTEARAELRRRGVQASPFCAVFPAGIAS